MRGTLFVIFQIYLTFNEYDARKKMITIILKVKYLKHIVLIKQAFQKKKEKEKKSLSNKICKLCIS